ncbi:MAG: isoaspartyl peptidase/L-asparaginase, partial [Ignavibacteria bacterium]
MNRRDFIATTAGVGALAATRGVGSVIPEDANVPKVLSTWDHGIPANKEALRVLEAGGSVIEAVERGVMVVEADPTNLSVGLSGLPDRDGIVTLDASIMSGKGPAGSVCFVQGIAHPISLARRVMEKTPHVMIVGAGAERFARENGMSQRENSLS